jgi:hypothetical protein
MLADKLSYWSDKIYDFNYKQYCERWRVGGLDVGDIRKVLEGCKINTNFRPKCLNVERVSGKYRTVKLVIEKNCIVALSLSVTYFGSIFIKPSSGCSKNIYKENRVFLCKIH